MVAVLSSRRGRRWNEGWRDDLGLGKDRWTAEDAAENYGHSELKNSLNLVGKLCSTDGFASQ